LIAALAALVVAAGTLVTADAAYAGTVRPPSMSSSLIVSGHGNGHGKGLSQYGARGAARQGLTAAAILAFYYPNTAVAKGYGSTVVRVKLTDDGADTVILGEGGLKVTGISGYLPPTGIQRWRLVPGATPDTLDLQAMRSGVWSVYRAGLPGTAEITDHDGVVWMYRTGTATAKAGYRGGVGAVRNGSGLITVNRLTLDDYVRGVVPKEMPGSWEANALRAQAVAARTYALYAVGAHADSLYDICDTSACQVYGGYSAEQDRVNSLLTAVAGWALTYKGKPIFAQYTADNGGWTAAGDQPYLIARPDPYEQYSDSPWLTWKRVVPVRRIADYFGLTTLTALTVSQRDGNGMWGGLTVAGSVTGEKDGKIVTITTDGWGLAASMGLPYIWFTCKVAPQP
jgi:hypothetical protein